MKYIIIIFIIVLFFLLCYLFLLKKELKRIREEINFIRTNPTNHLLHSELSNKEIEKMIGERYCRKRKKNGRSKSAFYENDAKYFS